MKSLIVSIGLAVSLASCASNSRLATNVLGAAGGAGLANVLSDGDPLMTAVGAAGGLLAGEVVNHTQEKKAKKFYTDGYDKGRSDAVKQQYWLLVDHQKKSHDSDFEEGVSLLEFPLPERMPDGTIFHPGSTRTLRIEE